MSLILCHWNTALMMLMMMLMMMMLVVVVFARMLMSADEEEEEGRSYYERYRILVQNECAGGQYHCLSLCLSHYSLCITTAMIQVDVLQLQV